MKSVAWSGRFIEVLVDGTWEYAARARRIEAAVIVAIDADDHVILVEQYRVPLGRRCLELPAGLIGDEIEGEDLCIAAARELQEETGYRAARIEPLGTFSSSPGMVSEGFTLVRAHDLTRIGDGGGTGDEDITVHRVPRRDIAAFVANKRADGVAIDVKMLVLLSGALLGD